ncbi:MAG TPA: helix-turn-helix transcriptional regulator [Tepidiformaceae bacterium]|nr:helix-turn-helix transcriptional regulator [Tepidiformaceae bacterium]
MTEQRPLENNLSASEQRALTYIRDGLVDAEIAVRLGISTAEVRELIARLQRKLRVSSRSELRRVQPPLSHGRLVSKTFVKGLAVALIALASASIGLAMGLVLQGFCSSEEGGTSATATPASESASRVVAEFNGHRMEDAGRLFDPAGGQLFISRSSDRAAATAVWLGVPGFIDLNAGKVQWRVVEGGILEGLLGERRIQLRISPVGETRAVYGSEQIALHTTNASDPQPVVLLAASGSDGEPLAVHVDREGRLFIAIDPLPPSAILETGTGEQLKVSGSQVVGRLPGRSGPGRYGTKCLGMDACAVSMLTTDGFRAPFAGDIKCEIAAPAPPIQVEGATAGQALALTGDFGTLVLWHVSYRGEPHPPCTEETRVSQGQILLPAGYYLLTAQLLSGEQLDVGLTLNGSLVVGRFGWEQRCPCFPD